MEFILNTARRLDNDQAREFTFGDETTLKEKLAVAFLNPIDLKEIKIEPKSNVRIFNDMGNIIVKCEADEKIPQGMVLMPVSIWANQFSFILNRDIIYKNIKVQIEPTEEKILEYNEIIQQLKRG
ncbi:MAG: hypothetical protein EU533_02600 [Promethearchaeota archaeon]|nr:MAG: hypothetical protein EU533_02600 [Candidatus Lokiarchaeota archaeon]